MVKIVDPSAELIECTGGSYGAMLELIGLAAVNCYKEESALDEAGSYERVCKSIIRRGHESVLEHASITVRIICDRGVSHELVRHRIGAYSQESTRYCNYSSGKFGGEITVIKPSWLGDGVYSLSGAFKDEEYVQYHTDLAWLEAMQYSERTYNFLIKSGWKPEQARTVLPNSLKTEIIVTFNIRQWRWVLSQRTSQNPRAHPQMREIMDIVHAKLKQEFPIFFTELPNKKGETFEK